MLVLSFDTADAFCTLVLSEDGKMLGQSAVEAGREQAKILAPLTEEFLKSRKLRVADLDRLAICTGPGSFTGLRVGLSFARGLSMAAQKPLFGFDHFICTREAADRLFPLPPGGVRGGNPENTSNAADHGKAVPPPAPPEGRGEKNLLIIRDSGRDELFAHLEQPFLASTVQLVEILNKNADVFFTGNGAGMIATSAPHLAARHLVLPREEIVFSAALLAAKAATLPNAPPEPLYLREADVTFQRV